MPELPEVETVKRGLTQLLKFPATIESIQRSKKSLRFKYPRGLKNQLEGQSILGIDRRAKYLLFSLGEKTLINHLGMTGNWRNHDEFDEKKHDHFMLKFKDGSYLIYNDVRRFGYVDVLKTSEVESSRWIEHLGPEPVGTPEWTAEELVESCKQRKSAIKTAIMNQEVVVGVGNIYASEALFRAGILPKTKCNKISVPRYKKLHAAIQETLREAIESGGSTIKDFKNAGGSSGYFQTRFHVYDKAGELCKSCDNPIQSATIGGRSTYWCSTCQK